VLLWIEACVFELDIISGRHGLHFAAESSWEKSDTHVFAVRGYAFFDDGTVVGWETTEVEILSFSRIGPIVNDVYKV